MVHTFSYDTRANTIEIATKCWSDFGAHIPLIRSFSMGGNGEKLFKLQFPEYPIYPGVPIRYHFVFYMIVGLLEKIGLRIDFALNIPSILGFAGLLTLIATLSYWCFRSAIGACLSVIFFLFNGTFSFIYYLQKHPISLDTPMDIMTNTTFPSFGPWDKGLVSAFWNLNIYTNQRHLAPGFTLGLLFILLLLWIEKKSWRKQIPYLCISTPILIILPYFHQPMLIILAIYMLWFFLMFRKLRLFLIATGAIAFGPILLQIIQFTNTSSSFGWYPGYLIHGNLTIFTFLQYWLYNFGLHCFLIPIGFFLAPKKVKLVTFPVVFLFILANCFKFSVEIAANHKFFNFFMIIGVILSAHGLIQLWSFVHKRLNHFIAEGTLKILHPLRYFFLTEIIVVCFLCVFSGIIDFFVIVNDRTIPIHDISTNTVSRWIAENTSKEAIFLNSSYLYHPASLAGRSIFLGWPYFSWSAGYEENRMPIMDKMYASKNPTLFCPLLHKFHITYITVEKVIDDNDLPDIDPAYFRSIGAPIFSAKEDAYMIFATTTLCPSL
jgi:hypothetical protein